MSLVIRQRWIFTWSRGPWTAEPPASSLLLGSANRTSSEDCLKLTGGGQSVRRECRNCLQSQGGKGGWLLLSVELGYDNEGCNGDPV